VFRRGKFIIIIVLAQPQVLMPPVLGSSRLSRCRRRRLWPWMFCRALRRALHCSVASVRPYSDVVG